MKRLLLIVAMLASFAGTRTARPAAQPAASASVPRRIISLVPATTEMLYAIGAGNRLVGVGTYDRYPRDIEKLPRLGGLLDPNIEQLIALRPDLVIVYDTQAELRRQLQRAGIGFWGYSIKDLADVTSTLRALGARIGMTAEASATAMTIESRLQRVRTRVSGQPRPKTLLVFGREPGSLRGINASGGYGFLHDLLELAGGTDVLAEVLHPPAVSR
jgi:iron complex transport system substrate-binding protein